jgi:AraC-like DNA-binding protein
MIQAIVHICIKIIFALQIPPILVKGIKKIKRYDKMVETNYADTDLRKMHMAKSILALFIVASIISFTANILGKEYFDTAPWLVLIPAATFFTLLFLLGYAGHKQNFTIQCLILETTNDIELPTGTEDVTTEVHEEEVVEKEVTEATEKTNEAIEAAEEEKQGDRIERLRKKIIETIDTERLFLQQDLKINDIAKLLHTNRDYIYQAINVRMGMSFSEYINRLRVDYAAQLMEKNPKMPTNEVAFRSGFSSLASFYRNFKAYKDCPPLTYKKESTSQD